MILKEWPETMAITKVPFETTTFIIQIHGLPPLFLHVGTAKLIGKRVESVHEESISKKCMVAQHFLRFRIDIEMGKPIQAGYFLRNNSDDEHWVQFKYERLGDFCCKCGMLDHITGRCSFAKLATIMSVDGATAQLYGLWIKSEHGGDLLFVNTPMVELNELDSDKKGNGFELQVNSNFPTSESLNHRLEYALNGGKETEQELQNAAETC